MRKHYFDNGKAIACFLGIIYHSSLVFSKPWQINVNENQMNSFLLIYTDYINLFRMPLFLFISGYFAAYSVKKYGFRDFSINKILRLGIPFISTLLTLNIIQGIYSKVLFKKSYTIEVYFSTLMPWNFDFSLAHLWFLYYVFIFSFLLYFISKISYLNDIFKSNFLIKHYKYIDVFLISLSIVLLGLLLVVTKVTGIDHALFSPNTIGTYLPYFIFGAITYNHWEYFENVFFNLTKERFIVMSFILIISMSMLSFNISDKIPYSGILFNVMGRYISLILVLVILFKLLNKTNRFLKYMSDSSYSVYLIHQPIIVVISFYYIQYLDFINTLLGYLLVLVSSTIIIYSIDFILIKNTKLGMFLFTGQTKAKSKRNYKKVV